MGSNLYPGDKIIIEENYNGTNYYAQGTVNAVTASSGAVTVAAWDSGSTFLDQGGGTYGYTANATVFKWQREYFDLRGSRCTADTDAACDRYAIAYLTVRVTDGSQGANVWLDDFRASGGYLTTPAGSTVTSSTGDQYFQYRVIETTFDTNDSTSFTSATIDYSATLAPPLVGTPTALSTSSIQWNFTDRANDETGFRIYDGSGNEITSNISGCSTTTANCSSFTETGLSVNTGYTRKFATCNGSNCTTVGSYSSLVTGYTLAVVPAVPTVVSGSGTATTVQLTVSAGTNPSATQLAIYKETGTSCDGSGGSYLAANGSDNASAAVWQTAAAWGTVTVSGLNLEQNVYAFCVKARNGIDASTTTAETAFSSTGSGNGGYIPLNASALSVTSDMSFKDLYKDASNSARYVVGLDSGTGVANTSVLTVTSGTLTVKSNETMLAGSIVFPAASHGTLIVAKTDVNGSGAVIKIGAPIWVMDQDGDHYAPNGLYYVGAKGATGGQPGEKSRRLNTMTTMIALDCDDTNASQNTACCVANGSACTSDGNCCSAVCATNADSDSYFSASAGHVGTCKASALPYTDCNDGSASVSLSHAQCYKDNDVDTYTAGLAPNSTCLNNASCNSATAASDSTDGASVTTYTAGQLKDSAHLNMLGADDCDDNDPTKWVMGHGTCGQ